MIVDDEQDFREMIEYVLGRANKYEVLALPDTKDIIGQMHVFKPELIILDLHMPGVSGQEASNLLSQDSLGKNIPVIIFSALDKDSSKIKKQEDNIVAYLDKSMDADDLIVEIDKILESKE